MNLLVSLAEGAAVFRRSHPVSVCGIKSRQTRALLDISHLTPYRAVLTRLTQAQSLCGA